MSCTEEKWLVHVSGPDDVFHAPSREAAEALARWLNEVSREDGFTRFGNGRMPGYFAEAKLHTDADGEHRVEPQDVDDFLAAMSRDIASLKSGTLPTLAGLDEYHREVARTFPSDEQHSQFSLDADTDLAKSVVADELVKSFVAMVHASSNLEHGKKLFFYGAALSDESRRKIEKKWRSNYSQVVNTLEIALNACGADAGEFGKAKAGLHALSGLGGELHEIHIAMVNGDQEDMIDEVGDALFFLTALCNISGFTLEDAMRANVAKLRARYPDGFSADRAVNKDEAAEELAMGSCREDAAKENIAHAPR